MRLETLPSTCPTFHDSVHHHLSVTSHQRPAFPPKRVWEKASSVANRWARAVTVFSIYGCLCGDRLWLMPEVSLVECCVKAAQSHSSCVRCNTVGTESVSHLSVQASRRDLDYLLTCLKPTERS